MIIPNVSDVVRLRNGENRWLRRGEARREDRIVVLRVVQLNLRAQARTINSGYHQDDPENRKYRLTFPRLQSGKFDSKRFEASTNDGGEDTNQPGYQKPIVR